MFNAKKENSEIAEVFKVLCSMTSNINTRINFVWLVLLSIGFLNLRNEILHLKHQDQDATIKVKTQQEHRPEQGKHTHVQETIPGIKTYRKERRHSINVLENLKSLRINPSPVLNKRKLKRMHVEIEKRNFIEITSVEKLKTSCVLKENCLDYHFSNQCAIWASMGECLRNPTFMIPHCRKACDFCVYKTAEIQDLSEIKNYLTEFNLNFKFQSDDFPDDNSWTLKAENQNINIINSMDEYITHEDNLIPTELQEFEYYCVVSKNALEDHNIEDGETQICYEFELLDSEGDGICCSEGNGYFTLTLNDETTPLIYEDNFNKREISTSFCIDIPTVIHDIETPRNETEQKGENNNTGSIIGLQDDIVGGEETYSQDLIPVLDSYSQYSTICTLQSEVQENETQELSEIKNYLTEFNLNFKFQSDDFPDDNSWTLKAENQNINIINSLDEYITLQENLIPMELQEFEYYCVVSKNALEDHNIIEDGETQICYEFEFLDSEGDGICCSYGYGYFTLTLNDETTPLIYEDNFNSKATYTSFCIDHEANLINRTSSDNELYQQRECVADECICDSNPSLIMSNSEDEDVMYDVKMKVLTKMMLLSGSENLINVSSPEYRAACWVLLDDPYEYSEYKEEALEKKIEERMVQRYIVSLFYFATSPEDWKYHYHFLSGKSECEWNNYDDFTTGKSYIIQGLVCDSKNNVRGISLERNKLGGSIINELHGLANLEYISLYGNFIQNTIPASLGRLPKLSFLHLFDNSFESSIPLNIFKDTKLHYLDLSRNKLTGKIPSTIGNARNLITLHLYENQLSNCIPTELYSLENLTVLRLNENKLSSTISSFIGNLSYLIELRIEKNMLHGQIPSSLQLLSRLEVLNLNENEFTGKIPHFFGSLEYLQDITLHDNNFEGTISGTDKLCETDHLTADCRNDVFKPKIMCSCCDFCLDNTPIWDGCADITLRIMISHLGRGPSSFHQNSDSLKWSLMDYSTGKNLMYDGPYQKSAFDNGKTSYETCAAHTGCFSLIMLQSPIENTDYTIYWNDEKIYSGTFVGYGKGMDFVKTDHQTESLVSFHYDVLSKKLIFDDDRCNNIEVSCGEETISIEPNTKERLIYNTVVQISGETTPEQSKTLCWMLTDTDLNNDNFTSENHDSLKLRYTQRYVLALLHLTSQNGLFGENEHPPKTHECEWEGVFCTSNIVAAISLSSEKNQIIGGTLLNELGSLAYLEKLYLSQTMLSGTIPQVYSNLWSLKELDLSDNNLSGSIPNTLFDQMPGLMYLNLSKNRLSSSIPSNLGKYSEITSMILSQNQFIGTFSLDSFKWFSLKHLDISENQLSNIDLELLVHHTHLETLNLGSNFFAGKLQENMFVELSKLKYFNISQNEIDGKIPTKFTMLSNVTHLDIHDNRFSGTVPMAITNLISMKVLNLQGNRLTGSIPSLLNELKQLEILALSNNELKGSIPLDLAVLTNVDGLYLHNNKLSGEAPKSSMKMKAYITDCGYPSDSLEPVSCSSCNICCNSDGVCQKKSNEAVNSTSITLIIIFSLYGIILLCYGLKRQITTLWFLVPFFSNIVSKWDGLFIISGRSVYHFMLTKNKIGWFIAFMCSIFQMLTLFLFVKAADINSESGDLEYTMTCPANSLDCENVKSVSPYGIFIFTTVIAVWLLRDIVSSLKLMLLSFEKKCIDFLFASGMIFLVTVLSMWTSIYYILAIATKNTDLIKDAVILLFVIEIDERIYQLAETINPDWVIEVELEGSMRNMRNGVAYTGDDLLISSWIRKSSENFHRSIPSLRSLASFPSFSKKRRENKSGI